MKIKLVVVDLQLSRLQKAALATGLGAALVMAGTVAVAEVPNEFEDNELLSAAKMNENFADLDTRLVNQAAEIAVLVEDLAATSADLAEVESKVHDASAFSAIRTGPVDIPSAAATTVVFDDEIFDLANEYNPATGVFTPANTGYYLACSGRDSIGALRALTTCDDPWISTFG